MVLGVSYGMDSVTNAIQQAQKMALKKNRREACALLNRTWKTTPSQNHSRQKIVDSLQRISQVFFTDKGQRLYEAGQVQVFDNPDMALNQLREAQSLEDENILVLSQMARAQIVKKDCDTALVTLEMARTLNPFANEPSLLELRALYCAKRFEIFRDKLKVMQSSDKWDQAFGNYLSAQDSLRNKASHKAYEILMKVTEEFPAFPEAFYYLARASQELEKDAVPYMQKYSILCKGVTLREKKKFSYEPHLCEHMKEVDDELASVARDY